jgi:hypothetical protein
VVVHCRSTPGCISPSPDSPIANTLGLGTNISPAESAVGVEQFKSMLTPTKIEKAILNYKQREPPAFTLTGAKLDSGNAPYSRNRGSKFDQQHGFRSEGAIILSRTYDFIGHSKCDAHKISRTE